MILVVQGTANHDLGKGFKVEVRRQGAMKGKLATIVGFFHSKDPIHQDRRSRLMARLHGDMKGKVAISILDA